MNSEKIYCFGNRIALGIEEEILFLLFFNTIIAQQKKKIVT